jgi:hypothetical protein
MRRKGKTGKCGARSTPHLPLFSILLITFLLLNNFMPAASVKAAAAAAVEDTQSFVVHLQIPPYQVSAGSAGANQIKIAGYDPSGAPGDPALPGKFIHIALPPDVRIDSLKVELVSPQQVALPGTYKFAPVPPPVTYQDGKIILSYGDNAAAIVDGKNTAVYQANAWFPPAVTGPVSESQMRKWRFASLLFTPVQYNPVTGQVQVTTAADLRVSYSRAPAASGPALAQAQAELSDTIMDGEAASLLVNYAQARAWYPSPQAQSGVAPAGVTGSLLGYAILTTNAIAAGSLALNAFVSNLQARGFAAQIVTETQYGGLTGQAPNGRAEKMRQWLINNYLTQKIAYVLLIGNPDPANGDVPMKMMWPRLSQSDGYRESPTDYFYADLTGNWNKDGDAYFGEYSSDGGTGGVDFAPEVYVGRIPVYTSLSGWGTTLDSILQKIMDYASSNDTSWRKAALLPMSYSDFYTDGAALGEEMKNDYLSSLGFATTTLYQHRASGCNSPSGSSANLVGGKVKSLWQANRYGLVTWWGHGNETGAYVGYGDGCSDGTILTSYDTSVLDNAHPAIVYQNSCSNGDPETTNNLGYALLIKGAVATVSASRVSWYSVGTWDPELYLGDNASLGYYFSQQVARGDPLGKALFDIKSQMGPGWGGETWMNLMDFNLYGDPAANLYSCKDTHEPNNDLASATPLAYNQTLTADICPSGDQDYYAFTGASGDRLVAQVAAAVNGSKLDPLITLYASDGRTVLAENDDDAQSSDAKLGYILKTTGVYYLKVHAWDGPTVGGPDFFYSLRLYTDNNPPSSVAITSPLPGAWLNPAQAAITVAATDAESGIRQVDFYWHAANMANGAMVYLGSDSNGSDGWSYAFNTGAEPDQTGAILYAYAYDYVGGAAAASVDVGIDRRPPSGSVTLSGQSAGQVLLQLTAVDNLSGVSEMRLSNIPNFSAALWQPYATTFLWPTPPNGGVFVQLRDNAGNLSRVLCSDPACPTYFVPDIKQ